MVTVDMDLPGGMDMAERIVQDGFTCASSVLSTSRQKRISRFDIMAGTGHFRGTVCAIVGLGLV